MCAAALQAHAATYYVIVSGLGGEPDYEQRFTAEAKDLDRIFKASGPTAHVATLTGADATAAKLREALSSIAREAKPDDDFALILIGHGTFDGVEYKFNLAGPDMTAGEIAALCDKVPSRRQLIVDTTSSSGGALPAFERPGRAVIAATKSGTEKNATVFARYWVEAFQDPSADTDHSDSISALKAFTYAARKAAAFYDSQKRLATEHAVFNDTARAMRSAKQATVKATCWPALRCFAREQRRRRPMTQPNARCSTRRMSSSRRSTRSSTRSLRWTLPTTKSS